MRKFIVHTRPIACTKEACRVPDTSPSVVEVEGDILTGMDDPSVLWLPQGEYLFRIKSPEFLHESHEVKQLDGSKKKELRPSVYHSHGMYDSMEAAISKASELVKYSFEFDKRKYSKEFTEEDVAKKIASIQKVMLP